MLAASLTRCQQGMRGVLVPSVVARPLAGAGRLGGMSLEIRRAVVADAPEVARIYVESWAVGFGHLMPPPDLDSACVARWRDDLDDPGPTRWRVAVRDGRIIGIVGVGPSRDPVDPGLGELDTIAVDPACWRSGIGAALMATAVDELTRTGYHRAILWTVAEYERGHRFYESQGWVLDGRTRNEGRQVAFSRSL
jgi:GNAT superfamily N-acetyltransferase